MDETSTSNNLHQYTRAAGHPKLVNELSTRYSAHLREKIDPFENVVSFIISSRHLNVANYNNLGNNSGRKSSIIPSTTNTNRRKR